MNQAESSELEEIKAKLRRERELSRRFLEHAPICCAISVDGTICFTNARARKALNIQEGDATDARMVDSDEFEAIADDLHLHGTVNWRPYRAKMASGEVGHFLVNAYLSEFEDTDAAIIWFVDMSELHQPETRLHEQELRDARDRAEESAKTKGAFLANMSHEIRTPMNAVLGLTHLLLRTDLTPMQRDYLQKTDAAARSLLGIVNDVLDFSKIEAGKIALSSNEFRLQDVLDKVTDQNVPQIGEKGLEFLVAVDPKTPAALVGDDMRLMQILNNLVSNAVKFTPAGEIRLEAEALNDSDKGIVLRFLVKDTGIGLTTEQREKLFRPFTQADVSTTRLFGGTGLGLAISKCLVEMMGGEIWCASQPGRGSLFGFTCRFEAPVKQTKYIETRAQYARLQAMVVDDSDSARAVVRDMLVGMGMSVRTASSGEAAVSLAKDMKTDGRRLDLLLMDWRMPGMDGVETFGRVASVFNPDRIPTILMTTNYHIGEATAAATAGGIKEVLTKPISPSALANTLAALFKRGPGSHTTMLTRRREDNRTAAERVKRFSGAKVLLAEDNAVNQLVATRILGQAGIVVEIASNGREAVDKTRSGDYDLVLMDIQMPEMDGIAATREIRRHSRNSQIPIVAMTAHALPADKEKSLAAGMNDHICKPLDVPGLFECLGRWLPVGERS